MFISQYKRNHAPLILIEFDGYLTISLSGMSGLSKDACIPNYCIALKWMKKPSIHESDHIFSYSLLFMMSVELIFQCQIHHNTYAMSVFTPTIHCEHLALLRTDIRNQSRSQAHNFIDNRLFVQCDKIFLNKPNIKMTLRSACPKCQ